MKTNWSAVHLHPKTRELTVVFEELFAFFGLFLLDVGGVLLQKATGDEEQLVKRKRMTTGVDTYLEDLEQGFDVHLSKSKRGAE